VSDERTGDVPAGAEAAPPAGSGHRHSDPKPGKSMRRAPLGAVLAAGTFAIAWFLPVVGDYVPEHARPPGWDAFLLPWGR
jgi:hypothetical protein